MNSENYDQITLAGGSDRRSGRLSAAGDEGDAQRARGQRGGDRAAAEGRRSRWSDTEPVTKGQTASSSYKPAMLSNGVRTNVPPFIGPGTRVVVMTEDGSYVERAKD